MRVEAQRTRRTNSHASQRPAEIPLDRALQNIGMLVPGFQITRVQYATVNERVTLCSAIKHDIGHQA